MRPTLAALLLALAACTGDPGGGTLRVFAAASLTEAFTELGTAFEAEHPGVEVTFTFGGSSSLARQLADGADADVFATADEEAMAEALDAGEVRAPEVVARNRLAIVVEEGNPRRIAGLADLAAPGTVVVVCAPEVPCGRLAEKALARAGVGIRPASLEEDVKAVVSKVALGEADAGIAYFTDVRAARNDIDGVSVDPPLLAVYPMAVTTRASDPAAARAWADFVTSTEGRSVLGKHGFLAP